MNQEAEKITNALITDRRTTSQAKPGLCRRWTNNALNVIRGLQLRGVSAQAREIDYETSLQHTFIGAEVSGEAYFFDGTGVGNEPPYFGPAEDAPKHLQNSRRDRMID